MESVCDVETPIRFSNARTSLVGGTSLLVLVLSIAILCVGDVILSGKDVKQENIETGR